MRNDVIVKKLYGLIFLLFYSTSLHAECSPNSKADSIILEMIKKYQMLLSYKDKGEVLKKIDGRDFNRKFETSYEKPGKFTLTWVDNHPRLGAIHYKVWGENQMGYLWRGDTEKTKKDSISKVLSGAHGISGGVAFRVLPWMLFEQEPCQYLGPTNNEIIKKTSLFGKEVYVIKRSNKGEEFRRIWVEVESLLLRRVESKRGQINFKYVEAN